jgi:hypothetical protein
MLQFSNLPPKPLGERAMPLKRTPPNGRLKAVITCDDLIGTNTHFFGGHTVPCTTVDCDACLKGVPWRWHGYVSAMQASTRLHFIFEFTAQAADTFREYFALHNTLKGCIFTAERMHHRPNGRVILHVSPGDLANLNLPKPPDLEACLRIIWHLPAKTTNNNKRHKGHEQIQIDSKESACLSQIGALPGTGKDRTPYE